MKKDEGSFSDAVDELISTVGDAVWRLAEVTGYIRFCRWLYPKLPRWMQ